MNVDMKCFICKRLLPKSSLTREHITPRFLDRENPSGTVRVCQECNINESQKQYLEYKTYSISKNKDPYKSFLVAMYELEILLGVSLPDIKLNSTMAKISFATAITAMETYLSDTFINRVTNDNTLTRRCIETDPEFKNRKLDLSDIFTRKEALPQEVRNYLVDILFHNLAKVKMMYQSVLHIEFPKDLGTLYKAIETRHDIVHRGGKNKSGNIKPIMREEVISLIATLKSFTICIEEQLSGSKTAD